MVIGITNKQKDFIKDSNINEKNDLLEVFMQMQNEYPCVRVSTASLRAIRIKLETSTDIEIEQTIRSKDYFCKILEVNLNRKINLGNNTSKILRNEIEIISNLLNTSEQTAM